jgi:hypothetical protein
MTAGGRPAPLSAQRRRRVVFGALLAVLMATGLYLLSPWLLPLRVVEGPLVQQTTETSARLIWYTSRGAECVVEYQDPDGQPHTLFAERSGWRHRAALSDLVPGGSYAYRVRVRGGRQLAGGNLRTNRPAGQPVRFLVFGDSGRATREQYQLAQRMVAAQPDFLLHTGDLIYGRGERSRYRLRFFRPYAEMLQSVAFWPSLGNHDVSRPDFGAPYREVFDLPDNGPPGLTPENNYWFEHGPLRVAVIDSTLDESIVGSDAYRDQLREQRLRDFVSPWLIRVMSDAPAWRIAVFHHPPYTGGSHRPDVVIQRAIVPAIEDAGIDLVFNGHDHMYERTHLLRGGQVLSATSDVGAAADGERGVLYVVSGAGGARLYDVLPVDQRPAYIAVIDNTVHSFTQVDVDERMLHARQIALDGRTLDEWSIVSSRQRD